MAWAGRCGRELDGVSKVGRTRVRERPNPGEREGQFAATSQIVAGFALRVGGAFAGAGLAVLMGVPQGAIARRCGRTLAFVRLMSSWDGSDSGSITPRRDGMQGAGGVQNGEVGGCARVVSCREGLSLARANRRSFDCASRDTAARGFAQDDTLFCEGSSHLMTVLILRGQFTF
jgi:hypothetical protein